MSALPSPRLEQNEIRWTLNTSTYPMDAIYGASYVFVDRCYVYLDAPAPRRVEVVLRGKTTLERADLDSLAGEFANALLHQVMRIRLAKRTGQVREMIVGRALISAQPGGGLAPEADYGLAPGDLEPLPEEELDDYLDDPLGIAVPWEDKYGIEADAPSPQNEAASPGAPKDSRAPKDTSEAEKPDDPA